MNRISAFLIVRDEEAFLHDCLSSIRDEVDEIVIVDTGSVDKTRDIAARFSTKVIEMTWTGDFAKARNSALDHATGDWILYIDADERLGVPKAGGLRQTVADPGTVAFFVRFQPKTGYTPYDEIRLFRRDERIRFKGCIHETVHPDINTVRRTDGLELKRSDIAISHVGYDGDITHKHHRNLPLLEEAVKVDPSRAFLWVDMAKSLIALGRAAEAEAACEKAIALGQNHSDPKQRIDSSVGWLQLITLKRETYPEDALRLAEEACRLYPDHKALMLARAGVRFALGEAESILPDLRDLTSIDEETYYDPLIAYDKRIFGEWAHVLLGGVHVRMGDREKAAECYRRAAEFAPDSQEYRVKAAAFASPQAVRSA